MHNETYLPRPVSLRNCYFGPVCAISRVARSSVITDPAQSPDIHAFRAAALRCPLPQAIELIGEKWAFLILRGALNGLQHFEQFQAGLGIARNILSNRLGRMVEGGILARAPDPGDKRRVIYSLTEKGEALLPVVIALRQWGEDWGHGHQDIVLADQRDGRPVRPVRVLAEDGRELELGDLMWVDRSSGAALRRAPG